MRSVPSTRVPRQRAVDAAMVARAPSFGYQPHLLRGGCRGHWQNEPFGHAWVLLNDRVWDPSPGLINPERPCTYAYFGVELLTEFVQSSLISKTVRQGYPVVDNPWRDFPVLRLDVHQVCR